MNGDGGNSGLSSWRIFIWPLLTIVWSVHIFWLSTETFGSNVSRPFLAKILGLLHLTVSSNGFWVLHIVLRKLSHMIEYAILGYLLYRSFRGQNRIRWQPQLAGCSIIVAAVYSITDEFHQAFVSGRGASLIDCGIDTSGAATAMLLVYISAWTVEKKAGKNTLQ